MSLRSGAYVEARVLGKLAPVQRHLLLVDATMPKVDSDAVVRHLSAACVYGIDLWRFKSPGPALRAAIGAGRYRHSVLRLMTTRSSLCWDTARRARAGR